MHDDIDDLILDLLREAGPGGRVSGATIGGSLGITRTAIWKRVEGLRAQGYEIDSQPRLGYTLTATPDILTAREMAPLLRTRCLGRHFVYHESLPSTNELAKQLAGEGAPDGTVVVAEEQGKGKGRLSRGWYSPLRKGIWFSIILRPPFLPSDAPKCTLLAAVAVIKAAEALGLPRLGIKWPNDILCDGKKLVGILTEMNAEMQRIHHLVIGTGVNVNLTRRDIPTELGGIATSLRIIAGKPLDRRRLFAEILRQFELLYDAVLADGFGPLLDEWRRYSITLGQEVNVIGVNETFSGRAVDIDADGALLVDVGGEVRRVLAGDVSIRPAK